MKYLSEKRSQKLYDMGLRLKTGMVERVWAGNQSGFWLPIPCSDELLDWLPIQYEIEESDLETGDTMTLVITKVKASPADHYRVRYQSKADVGCSACNSTEPTLAEALGRTFIHMLDWKIITVDQINLKQL